MCRSYIASNEAAILAALDVGTVAVYVEADSTAFTTYQGGILTAGSDCGTSLNHGTSTFVDAPHSCVSVRFQHVAFIN
jgi:hypothetical protein